MNVGIIIIVGVISAFLAAFIVFITYRSRLGSMKNYKFDMLESARKEGETLKKELILEGKDEAIRIKQKSEDEYNEKLKDVRNSERELQKRESNLDRKVESIDQRYDSLQKYDQDLKKKEQDVDKREEEIEKLIDQQQSKLEKIAGLSREEAKQTLKDSLYEKARIEAQVKVKDIKESAILNANKEAKKIIIEAIQRSAADHTSESTVAVVALPNDQMKGRVIGREGRNIRHFEALSGIELIVDDTPEAVVLSGFDPVRREVARIALEKLISDGYSTTWPPTTSMRGGLQSFSTHLTTLSASHPSGQRRAKAASPSRSTTSSLVVPLVSTIPTLPLCRTLMVGKYTGSSRQKAVYGKTHP